MDELLPQLTQLAKTQQAVIDMKAKVEAARKTYVEPLETELETLERTLGEYEKLIKDTMREYALSTGDFKASEYVEVKRKPVAYIYDEDEVMAEAEKRGATEFIRTKKELNKVELNRALKSEDEKYSWIQAEPVKDITVTIRPLGDLLIRSEIE